MRLKLLLFTAVIGTLTFILLYITTTMYLLNVYLLIPSTKTVITISYPTMVTINTSALTILLTTIWYIFYRIPTSNKKEEQKK